MEQEQTLRQQAQAAQPQIETILSGIQDGFYVLDRNWRFTYVNGRYCEMVSIERSALIGQNIWALFPAAIDTEAYERFHRAFRDQTPMQFDYLYAPWNCWHDHRIYPSPNGLSFFLADITDRKQTELMVIEQRDQLASIALERDRSICALRESEERLNLAIEASGMATWDADLQTGKAIWSPNHYHILGYDPATLEEPTIEMCLGRVHPDDLAEVMQAWAIAQQGRSPYQIEHRFVQADTGQVVWIAATGRFLANAAGETVRFVGVMFDISDRKQAEEALRLNQERLAFILKTTGIGLWLNTLPLSALNWDDQTRELFFTAPNVEPTIELFWSRVHPEDREPTRLAVETALSDRTLYEIDHRAVNPDTGEIRWIRSAGQATYASDGTPILFDGINYDISDRKQADAKLQETLTLLNAISDYSLDIIFAKDRTGRLLFVNPAISRYFGKSVDELLGKDEFFFIEDRAAAEAIQANDQRIMRSGVAEVLEEPIIIDGHLQTFLSTKAPLRDANGNILGIIGIGHDITERKQAEADLEKRNQELDSFVYIASHDLKAPLRAISNLSQWLEDDLEGQLPPENQQQIQLLRARVLRMESMINNLLLYARAGRQETPLETFNVAELLSEIIDSLAPPQGFSINIEQPMPTLTTKRLFLSQVFANLIGNAIKHHTSVQGHLDIRGIEQRNFYEFMVKDDGPGIAPEHHAKIFTIFQTIKAEDNRESTGVGLAIVKKIIEMEEGTIRVESCVGNGTTFFFTWPKRYA